MRKKIRNKIEELREQPDHIKFRAASYTALVGGGALVIIWLAVFLPFQLFMGSRGDDESVSSDREITVSSSTQESPVPQVGGVQQTANEQKVPLFVTPEPTPTDVSASSSSTPTPSPSESVE